MDILSYYSINSCSLLKQYESLSAEFVNKAWVGFIPAQKSRVLDIGAGSGRDAAWMTSMGHDVVAVEPADELRLKAMAIHSSSTIIWIKDTLPELNSVYDLCMKFDLVLVNAVWMHLLISERENAFRKLVGLLNPLGKLVISLRHGPSPDERKMYPVSCSEIRKFAAPYNLDLLLETKDENDKLGREEVSWSTIVLANQ